MMLELDGVKLLLSTATGYYALVMVPSEVCAKGGAVFPSSGVGVSGVGRASTVRANPKSVVNEVRQGVARW